MKTSNITGAITIPNDRDIIIPGDNCEIHVELEVPGVVWPQLRFAMREGGYTVAVGVVTEVLEYLDMYGLYRFNTDFVL
eukprot:UN06592